MQGMDVARVRASVSTLHGHLSTLDHLASELAQTKRAALDPHAHGIGPGELTIAPWSIGSVGGASTELSAARSAIQELLHRLGAEADAQVTASGNAPAVSAVRTKHAGALFSKSIAFTGDASDPAAVKAWWASLSAQQQELLIASEPQLVGMLDGIPYSVRDRANQLALDEMRATLVDLRDQYYDEISTNSVESAEAMLASHGYDILSLLSAIDASDAIQATLATGTDSKPRTLVQLDFGPPITAAIAIGDMDTASQVTTLVPGMGTTVTDSMESWARAGENLWSQQDLLNRQYGDESGLAVVAWIGYDTPVMPWVDPMDVERSDKAEAGGERLADFLEGVSGTRGWSAGDNLSVVAHSYGTTTAMFAAANTPVENLTLLASAGADSSIDSVRDLKVQQGHIWAAEADGDDVADVGRWSWTSQHPNNPMDANFGANTFSAEDSTNGVSGELHGSDGHPATPHSDAVSQGQTTSDYGYLDKNTTPLYNAAVTSLGLGSELLAGPFELRRPPGSGGGGGGGGW